MLRVCLRVIAFATFVSVAASSGFASPISYQGKLSDNGTPANGLYDFRAEVLDVNSQLVAGPEVVSGVSVVDGLFTLSVDFAGHDFSETGESLLIGVRPANGGAFTTLGSQPILNTPRAVFAEKSGMGFNDIYANGSLFDLTGKFLNILTGTASGNGGLLLQDEAEALGVFGKFQGGISATVFGKMSPQHAAVLGVSQSSDQAYVLLDNAVTG